MVLATYDLVKLRLFGAGLVVLGWLTLGLGIGIWFLAAGLWALFRSKAGNEIAIACHERGITVRNPFTEATIPYARYRAARVARSTGAPSWFAGFLVLERDGGTPKGKSAQYLPLNFLRLTGDGAAAIDRAIRDCALKYAGQALEAPVEQPAARATTLAGAPAAKPAPMPAPIPAPMPSIPETASRPAIIRPRPAPIPKTLEGDRGILG